MLLPRRQIVKNLTLGTIPSPLSTSVNSSSELSEKAYPQVVVDNIEALIDLRDLAISNVFVLGYHTRGDGGGGHYYRDIDSESTTSDNSFGIRTRNGSSWNLISTGEYSVKQFGAKGDGTTDDSAAVQRALDASQSANSESVRIFFPPGKYKITAPLRTRRNYEGMCIAGAAARQPDTGGSKRTGSIINYVGEGALFTIESMLFVTISDLGFSGTSSNIAFRFLQPARGCGMSTFDRCVFSYFGCAVEFGRDYNSGGCADVGFTFCVFSACLIGVNVKNRDGANYVFDRLYAGNCRTVISSVPGSISIRNSQIVRCGTVDSFCFDFKAAGDNSGFVSFDGLRFEQGTINLLRMTGKGRLCIVGAEEAQATTKTSQFILIGIAARIQSSRFTSGTIESPLAILSANDGSQPSRIDFDQVYFDISDDRYVCQKIIGFSGEKFAGGFSISSSNVGAYAARLADSGGSLGDSLISLQGYSEDSSAIELTITGGAGNKNTRLYFPSGSAFFEITVVGTEVLTKHMYRFVRNVAFSKSSKLNIVSIGNDLDGGGFCQIEMSVLADTSLNVKVRGPEGEACHWKALCFMISM